MTKTKKYDLHKKLLAVAKDEIKRHIETEDGEKCFNIFTYLQSLESRVDSVLDSADVPLLGGFELDPHTVARYVWACVAMEEGQQPYATTFRGMPTLD